MPKTLYERYILGIYSWSLANLSAVISFLSLFQLNINVLNSASLHPAFEEYIASLYTAEEIESFSDVQIDKLHTQYIDSISQYLGNHDGVKADHITLTFSTERKRTQVTVYSNDIVRILIAGD